jgi:hypothetical protein
MAGILQLRRGLKSTYISEGTNLAEAFFVTENTDGSAISPNTLIVGVSGSVGDDVMTLAKLSLANKDNTYADYNSGSFWITGDYTGSNMILSDNAIISGSAFIEGDLHLEGHLYLGSGSDGDIVKIQSEFSGSLVPDNDLTGSTTPDPTVAHFDLGSDQKRWKNIYLQRDVASGSDGGFISASHIDLTGNVVADNLGRFGTLRVDDLDDNRILVTAPLGQVEHDDNLQWDGSGITIIGDYYQAKAGASFQFDGAGMDITGSISNYQLSSVNDGIVFTATQGTLTNSNDFTWDSSILKVNGNISASQTLEVDGHSTLASATVEDLIEDRIIIADAGGRLGDDQYFRYTGTNFIIGSDEHFKVQVASGNTFISGAVQMFSTLNVDDQSTLASLNVEDLTDNRVVIVGAGGEIEDDGNFTFNGTELNIGTGNFTVQQGSGNTQILGTLDVDSQSTLASLNVEDLTDNRIVIVGTSGEIEDDANFTFNGTELNIGTGNFTVQQGSGNTQILGTLDVDSQSTLSSLNVQDLTSGRVVLAGTSGEIEDSGNLTFDGSTLTVTGNTIVTGNLTIEGTQTQLNTSTLNVEDINILIASGAIDASAANGAGITIDGADATLLYGSSDDSFTFNKLLKVNGNISGSSFNGTTLLSSSNENFADYSQSVDSRLDYLEGPFSTSVDSRLVEIFATGSDHETRIDVIETTYATTGSNSFLGDQIITGSLIVSSSSTFTNIGPSILSGSVLVQGTSTFGGNLVPEIAQGATLGTAEKPFSEIFLQSGSISIESDTPGDPSALISNKGGNLEVSVGGMLLVQSDASFIAPTGSFSYLSSSFYHEGTAERLGDTIITGSVDITGSSEFTGDVTLNDNLIVNTHTQFNHGGFISTQNISGSAGVSGSVNFDSTNDLNNVSLVSNSRITVANAGTYNIQFSAQIDADAGAGTMYIWFKKNGINIADSATKVELSNNDASVMTVNILDTASDNDYYEIAYQNTDGNLKLKAVPAAGNIPGIPSVITTITQVG